MILPPHTFWIRSSLFSFALGCTNYVALFRGFKTCPSQAFSQCDLSRPCHTAVLGLFIGSVDIICPFGKINNNNNKSLKCSSMWMGKWVKWHGRGLTKATGYARDRGTSRSSSRSNATACWHSSTLRAFESWMSFENTNKVITCCTLLITPSWGHHSPIGIMWSKRLCLSKDAAQNIPRPQGSPVSCSRSTGVNQQANTCFLCSFGKDQSPISPQAGQNIFSITVSKSFKILKERDASHIFFFFLKE